MRGPTEGQNRPASEYILSGNRSSIGLWPNPKENLDDMNPVNLSEDFKDELGHVVKWFSFLSDDEKQYLVQKLLIHSELDSRFMRLAQFSLNKKVSEPTMLLKSPAIQGGNSPKTVFSEFCSATNQQIPTLQGFSMDARQSQIQQRLAEDAALFPLNGGSAGLANPRAKNPPPPIGSPSSRPVSYVENNRTNLDRFSRWNTSGERPKSADFYSLFSGDMSMFIPHTVPEAEEHLQEPPAATVSSSLMPSLHVEPPARGSPLASIPATDARLESIAAPYAASPMYETNQINTYSTINNIAKAQYNQFAAETKGTPLYMSKSEQTTGVTDIDVVARLRSLRLHKYKDNFKNMEWTDIIKLNEDQLEELGVAASGARRKMLREFDKYRQESAN